MRWQGQELGVDDRRALPGLGRLAGLVRSVTTPEFAGVTFHEVLAKSALNKVPDASSMPFRWTVNPYRGCSHGCVYCYARGSHRYLDLGTGDDFDRQLVVKTNVAEVLARELARASWSREHVALGTNTDPYQRAEGRYRLMPGVIEALAASGTPLSVLTKGTLLRRDLPLLAAAAEQVGVGIGVSIAVLDDVLQPLVEPGTPSTTARLALVSAVREAGLSCGVMIAPVLPWLTDSVEHLDALLAAVAEAGATGVHVSSLHLRPGAREWYFDWLRREHPELVAGYHRLYGGGAYASAAYRRWLHDRARPLVAAHGLDGGRAAIRTGFAIGMMPAAAQGSTGPPAADPTLF